MTALDRKLIRDLRRIWVQCLAIALVLGCGVMVLVLAQGAERALTQTRDTYYERNRFAEVFASATRAPQALAGQIAQIKGVAAVETRISFHVVVDLPGMAEPAMARVLSLPVNGLPVLNVPVLRSGRWPDPLRAEEVALSESFADANALRPGAHLRAILNGRMQDLVVTGTMLSPEFIYLIGPGAIMPDDRRFGLIWMGQDAAAAATDLKGAFNDVSLQVTRGASVEQVKAELDVVLAPFGGTGANGREQQISHAFLKSELDQLAAMARIVPPIFLVVAAFLVNMVLGRLMALERPQIGLLKAIGYTKAEITQHYLKMSVWIGVAGVLLGWAAGVWLGQGMTALYARFYRFPYLIYAPGSAAFVLSGGLGIATVLIGALRSVRRSAALSPAVAMQPPAPPMFKRGWLDTIGGGLHLRQTTMMILRSITRWPGRAAVTLFGVAASVSVLIASFFVFDAMDQMVDDLFTQTNRQNVSLQLSESKPLSAVQNALSLPGVLRAEGSYVVPVRISNRAVSRLVGLEAQTDTAILVRQLDADGQAVIPPLDGLTLPSGLAKVLGLGLGDFATVEFLLPPRETYQVQVMAVNRQNFGQTIYLSDKSLFGLLRQAPQINRLNLLVDNNAMGDLYGAIKHSPTITGAVLWTDVRKMFDETMNENMLRMTTIYSVLGILITIGVVYNAARIQLSERAHELASLRVLGFTRAEVGYVLVGEVMLLSLLALPLGWLLGAGFAAWVTSGFSTDMIDIPLVISRKTYGTATLIVGVSALVSALVVRRRLDRVDIAMALKQRE